MSSAASSFSTTAIARALVSISAKPQNWLPVHDTRPRSRLPARGGAGEAGAAVCEWWAAVKGSAADKHAPLPPAASTNRGNQKKKARPRRRRSDFKHTRRAP
jgi:hypothetical protein